MSVSRQKCEPTASDSARSSPRNSHKNFTLNGRLASSSIAPFVDASASRERRAELVFASKSSSRSSSAISPRERPPAPTRSGVG